MCALKFEKLYSLCLQLIKHLLSSKHYSRHNTYFIYNPLYMGRWLLLSHFIDEEKKIQRNFKNPEVTDGTEIWLEIK